MATCLALAVPLEARAQPTDGSITSDAPTTAAPSPPVAETPHDAASRRTREGLEHARSLAFVDAVESFRAAYAIEPRPSLLINLGTALRYLGREAEAADLFERFLASGEGARELRTQLARQIAEIDGRVARLRFIAAAGVDVRVDGRPIADRADGRGVRVDPGERTIVATAVGKAAAVRHVTIRAGTDLDVRLDPPPTPRAPPVLRVVERGVPTTTAVAFAVGALGVVGVGTGAVVGALALSSDAEARDHCTPTGACDDVGIDRADDAESLADGSTVAFALGASLVVASVVLFAWPSAAYDEETAPPVALRVAPAGLRVEGAW